MERALEAWLFGPAGNPEHRFYPACATARSSAAPVILTTATPARWRGTRPTVAPGRSPSAPTPGPGSRSPCGRGATCSWARSAPTRRRRALLALPRTVGTHPETGKAILAGIGRYGPRLKHGAAYVALPEDEDVLAVGLNRAVTLVDTA